MTGTHCAQCKQPFQEGDEIREKDHSHFHAPQCLNQYTAQCRFLIQFQREPTLEERSRLFEQVARLGRPPQLSWDLDQNEMLQLFAA